jgi:hypothetical protein
MATIEGEIDLRMEGDHVVVRAVNLKTQLDFTAEDTAAQRK